MKSDVNCRVCKGLIVQKGLLVRCVAPECGAVHWDKLAIKKKIRAAEGDVERGKKVRAEMLRDAEVPVVSEKAEKHHFVYVLRLRDKPPGSVYVGMTGLHPYARYLNHLWGYKASATAKKRATAMVKFEGPMYYKDAIKREVALAEELRQNGHTVTQH